jgi:hypothetical protein
MQHQAQQRARDARAPIPDARAWLAAWADHGGIAMLLGPRLYVSRLAGLDRGATQRLNELRGWIMRPGAGEALAGVLGRATCNGEEEAA